MRSQTERLLTVSFLCAATYLALPAVAWAAENEGGRSDLLLEIGKFVNLLLVVGVLVWIARKPLANFFAGRTQAIRDQLEEAQRARREAEARLAEISSAMSSLDDELRQIRETAEKEAQEEYQRLLSAAERDAEKIVDRARREIDGMTRAAQLELKAQVAELSVQLAKEEIQHEMTDDDRSRLFERFVAKVGGRE
ncbi:MAG: ATP synthase F0 subunit B [Acidobacteriota bacterium]|jgi:F-type H+-transporting ATPase subunit b